MSNDSKSEFEKLISACYEIADYFQDGVVFIGGIAVYLHAVNNQSPELSEFTHDADLYISLADMSDLRDIEEVTPNRRLSKHQFIKHGFEFDVYTEKFSSLIVPYDEILAHSVVYDRIKVCGLPHLIALKLEAYKDRYASAKGSKDAKDIIRLLLVAHQQIDTFDPTLIAPYIGDEHIDLMDRVIKGAGVAAIACGNAQKAKNYRQSIAKVANVIRAEIDVSTSDRKPHPKCK